MTVQLSSPYRTTLTLSATEHSITDRRTDRQTERRQYDANSRSYSAIKTNRKQQRANQVRCLILDINVKMNKLSRIPPPLAYRWSTFVQKSPSLSTSQSSKLDMKESTCININISQAR